MFSQEIFCERLIAHRKSKGLSMPQLGNEFGTTKQTVFKWENGITVPPLSVVCALADYFNVSLDYLVGRDDVPNRKDYHE